MTNEEKAKNYAISRTYPKFETDYIANFVLREVEGAFLAGRKSNSEVITELEKENEKLKADNDARKFAMAMSEKVEKQLREENARLKADRPKWHNVADGDLPKKGR